MDERGHELWLLDGYNVLHAALLATGERGAGWWTEERRARVLERARAFDDPRAEIWVVFDGDGPPGDAAPARGVRAVYAPSADAWLLARVRAAADPGRIAVVTADRSLAARARGRGARAVSPRAFLARCRTG